MVMDQWLSNLHNYIVDCICMWDSAIYIITSENVRDLFYIAEVVSDMEYYLHLL